MSERWLLILIVVCCFVFGIGIGYNIDYKVYEVGNTILKIEAKDDRCKYFLHKNVSFISKCDCYKIGDTIGDAE